MPRLTREEIVELEGRLAEWQTPQSMSHLVSLTMDRIGSVTFFNQAGLTFLRDAWIAAEFGQIRQAEQIRLVADDWPDFELKIDDQVESFESVEADDPNRRRGDEYHDSMGEMEHDPVEHWIVQADLAQTWLEIACQRKVNKRYGARANLVVYLNLSEYGIRQTEVESCFPSATAAVKDNFDAVWVLWKKQAYLVWPSNEVT